MTSQADVLSDGATMMKGTHSFRPAPAGPPQLGETGGGDGDDPLYAARRKIYPQSVKGRFRTIKWAILFVALGLYYFAPFLRWDRGPNAPSQAILLDMPNRRFYFFFIEIWPQEVYYITGLLILASLSLFLMNAVAGRLWCGYLCPQTVWTDLFQSIERFCEGDRRAHYKLDQQPWTAERVGRRAAKYFLWLMVAWWTGGAWVLYFADAPTLVTQLATFTAPTIAYVWIGILTLTTFVFAGLMREQVCTYMCPWPRIQAALTDEHALNVTYRYDRGEPRGSFKKTEALRKAGQPAGDCVDCDQCVAVCPTGVDIRKGLQIDCIQCGLCIDACDAVMTKVGRPTGLIGYDTDLNVHRRERGEKEQFAIVRPRTVLYAALIVVVSAIMVFALLTRATLGINAMHDRNPVYVRLSDGGVRNAYTVRILNKTNEDRRFAIYLDNLPSAKLEAVGAVPGQDGAPVVAVGPDQTREIRLLATAPASARVTGQTDVTLRVVDMANGNTAKTAEHFIAP